mgnify:CR=1 FL=1
MIKVLITGYSDSTNLKEAARKVEEDIRAMGIKKEEIISVTRTVNSYDFTEIMILYERRHDDG